MASAPAFIGILEDDDDLRTYLAKVVEREDRFTLAFTAATLAEAKKASRTSRVDACLVDLELPDGTGYEFTRDLKARGDAKVLILTVLGDRKSVLRALEDGADGYLLKDTAPDQIVNDLESVLAGDTPISPQAATHLLRTFTNSASRTVVSRDEAEALTERECETLLLFQRGLSYREAAETLGVSHNTVRTHVKAIYAKLGVHSRNEALFEAKQIGLLNN